LTNQSAENTAVGAFGLLSNIGGDSNSAFGSGALVSNTNGVVNTGIRAGALNQNVDGADNTATGFDALYSNTNGSRNTATGVGALDSNSTGSGNIALGFHAGNNITGDNNIDIGNEGSAGDSDTIRIGTGGTHTQTFIAGVYGTTILNGVTVQIDQGGHLGAFTSSARFKRDI
jgi:hypothetical protein